MLSPSGDSVLNETAGETRFKRHLLAYPLEWRGDDPGGSAAVGQTERLPRREAGLGWEVECSRSDTGVELSMRAISYLARGVSAPLAEKCRNGIGRLFACLNLSRRCPNRFSLLGAYFPVPAKVGLELNRKTRGTEAGTRLRWWWSSSFPTPCNTPRPA